jgi:hypothetical protein
MLIPRFLIRRRDARILGLAVLIVASRFEVRAGPAAGCPGAQESKPREGARPGDVASIDSIVQALYESISGPPGPRDWERLRHLFLPGARLIPCGRPPGESTARARVFSIDEFITRVEAATKEEGFFEREVHRRLERFGAVAHLFSTYESRHAAKDEKPFIRGVNSIQLFFDGKRWWVVTIFWDSERPDQPIPPEYLPAR